ncbi:hypothetical protein BDF14DRAFT_1813657 [Spinellus fusiger]|nr:hypothetical protein BDF14DRAFT_1813657 [Spinellus fusiger]
MDAHMNLYAPPRPRRSPHRLQAMHVATETPEDGKPATDIYYADSMTLPNLLKLLSDSQNNVLENPHSNKTIEEQLDDTMKMLTSQSME